MRRPPLRRPSRNAEPFPIPSTHRTQKASLGMEIGAWPVPIRAGQAIRSANCRATRDAIAMMVIIGLTPIELGSRLPSAA